jgi:hypothetical protein
MPSIRITRFAGLLPEVNPRALREDHAQIAHNALLWDGWLRAMPQWAYVTGYSSQPASLLPDVANSQQYTSELSLSDGQVVYQEPYVPGTTFGIAAGLLAYRAPASFSTSPLLPPASSLVASYTQSVVNQNLSVYPIPRTYAITFLAGNMESAPCVFTQLGGDGSLYEGDAVTLTINTTIDPSFGTTGYRLYRTVPGFDTSEQLGNPVETGFHLVYDSVSGQGSLGQSVTAFVYTYQLSDPGHLMLVYTIPTPVVFTVGMEVTITVPVGHTLYPLNGGAYVITSIYNSQTIVLAIPPGTGITPAIDTLLSSSFLLYVSGSSGGSALTNPIVYVDTADASKIPGDLLLTEQFGPPLVINAQHVAQTETGWLVVSGYASNSGYSQVALSERFLWHAWPMQNTVQITDQIVDMVAFYDDIFIGTLNRPYHLRAVFNDNVEIDSLSIDVKPYPDFYACVPNSMVTTNFGAMYASPDGLVSLEVNEDAIASKRITNPGDQLLNPVADITISSVQSAAWWNGFYLGLCSSVGYLFNVENSHNNQFPLGQLITFDTPAGIPGANLVTGGQASGGAGGFFGLWGNQLYTLPLPGYGYETSAHAVYTWKSKVFVLPGGTTMAAAKVVGDYTQGAVTFYLYGDSALIYAYTPTDGTPFRLPHNHSCINWEIELIGQTAIEEVHVATSMRDLTEETGAEHWEEAK